MSKTVFASLATIVALGCAATAHGATVASGPFDPETTSVTVSVGDLNLGSPAGARVALQRFRSAASTICGAEPDIREGERLALYQACLKTTVGQAVASLDAPLVTAMNDGQRALTVADRH